MSDVSQGPGWWMASDGKWYPPESHPNYAASAQPPATPSYQPLAPAMPMPAMVPAPAVGPNGEPLALWGWRALAYLIDGVILGVVGIVLLVLTNKVILVGYLLDLVVTLAYGTYFVGVRRSTPGMSALRLTASDEHEDKAIGPWRALARAALESAMAVLCWIVWVVDILFPLWDAKRQTLHDKATRTVVTRRPQ